MISINIRIITSVSAFVLYRLTHNNIFSIALVKDVSSILHYYNIYVSKFAFASSSIVISSGARRNLFITPTNSTRTTWRVGDVIERSMAAMNFDSSLWNYIDYRDLIHFSLVRIEWKSGNIRSYQKSSYFAAFVIDQRRVNNNISKVNTLKFFNMRKWIIYV